MRNRNCAVLVIMLLASTLGWGQQPIMFDTVRLNPLNSFLIGLSVFETDEGYLVWGMAGDGTGEVQEIHTLRFNAEGEFVNELGFSSDRLMWPGSFAPVTRSTDGMFATGVSVFGNGDPIDSLFFFRFSAEGDTLSTTFLVSDSTVAVRKCIRSSSGDHLLVGIHERPTNAFLCRTSWNGELVSFNLLDDVQPFFAMSIAEDESLDLFICGYGQSVDNNSNANLIKCAPDGTTIWRRTKPRYSAYNHVVVMADGGVVALGSISVEGNEPNRALVVKYTSDGTELWSRDIVTSDSPNRSCYLTDGFQLPDGSLVVCGSIRNTTTPGLWDNGMVHKLDADGNVLWSRYYAHYTGLPVGYDHIFNAVQPTSDGGFILTGEAQGQSPPNRSRLWLVKLDSMGCLVPGCHTVGVEEYESQLQNALRVSPNPANEQFNVELALPEGYRLEGAVQAILVDAQGKEVKGRTIGANGAQLRAVLEVADLPSGLYYVHLLDEVKWLAGGKVVVK